MPACVYVLVVVGRRLLTGLVLEEYHSICTLCTRLLSSLAAGKRCVTVHVAGLTQFVT